MLESPAVALGDASERGEGLQESVWDRCEDLVVFLDWKTYTPPHPSATLNWFCLSSSKRAIVSLFVLFVFVFCLCFVLFVGLDDGTDCDNPS